MYIHIHKYSVYYTTGFAGIMAVDSGLIIVGLIPMVIPHFIFHIYFLYFILINIFVRCTSSWCSPCSFLWNTSGVISSSRTTQWVQPTDHINIYIFDIFLMEIKICKGNTLHNRQENPECRRHYSKETFFVAGSQLLSLCGKKIIFVLRSLLFYGRSIFILSGKVNLVFKVIFYRNSFTFILQQQDNLFWQVHFHFLARSSLCQ